MAKVDGVNLCDGCDITLPQGQRYCRSCLRRINSRRFGCLPLIVVGLLIVVAGYF